jgi:hypothetical protein
MRILPPPSYTCAASLLVSLFAAGNARAQPTTTEHSAADVTLARQLGNEGIELAGAGNCAAAVDPLSRSEAMHHAPTTLSVLGECHVALGKLVQGAEELTRVVRENIEPQAPALFHVAQERARARLEETRPRIPKLRLVVQGAAAKAALTILVDGESIPAESVGLDRPVDPGTHRVEVTAGGYKPASGEVTLAEGQSQSLSLELVPLPESEIVAEGDSRTSMAFGGARRAPSSRAPGYVLLGVGAVGLAAGAIFGVVTLSKTSSLDKLCPTRSTCPSNAQSDIDLSKTTAWASTISFGVGGAAVLAGLYFTLRGRNSEPSAATARSQPSGAAVRAWIDLGSAGFDGTF